MRHDEPRPAGRRRWQDGEKVLLGLLVQPARGFVEQQDRRRREEGTAMWYFSWTLGLGLASTFGILNAIWFELRKDEVAKLPSYLRERL